MNSSKLPRGFSLPMKIGGGTFGSVYRVRQASLDRWVALKIINEKQPAKRKTLLKEATTQAQIHISCIPQVYDAFEWKNSVCIVMQWIKGISLRDLLKRSPSQQERLWLADGFIRALARLHREEYAHRDIKPANIVVSPTDGIYLVDFSFTKKVSDARKSMSGIVKGTPAYMAPELWRGMSDVDHMRADLYSAGVILKEILSSHDAGAIGDMLLCEEPVRRPANAVKLLEKWQAQFGETLARATWEAFAGQITSQLHAQNLVAAAQNLLMQGRHDEAYWLLVECLEEDPNYTAALELMNRFPALTRAKALKRNTAVALAACLAVAAVALAVFVARNGREPFETAINSIQTIKSRETMLRKSARQASTGSMENSRFIRDSVLVQYLTGQVFLKKCPPRGVLKIDGRIYAEEDFREGISLPFGMHVLSWTINDEAIVWRERIFILPFQVKGLSIQLG